MTGLEISPLVQRAASVMLSAEPVYEPLIGIDVWTMIFTCCNLLLVFWFARRFLLGPIKKMIDSRQQEIDQIYADAEKSRQEGELYRTEYEQKLEAVQIESETIMRESVKNARQREEAIVKEAREEATAILRRADEQIEMEKRQAVNDIKNEVSDMAVNIAGAVLEREVGAEEHAALIDSFIDRLGEDK